MPADGPRYAPGRPLPPYRYLPGTDPHPITDPRGHSFGHRAERPEVPPPDRWADCPEYLWAVDLHNAGYWWEAHEAWEGLWQTLDKTGEQAIFIQGLIQVSAALLKARMGSAEGMRILVGTALAKLRPVAARGTYMGIDLQTFLPRVEALKDLTPPLPDERIPRIRLA